MASGTDALQLMLALGGTPCPQRVVNIGAEAPSFISVRAALAIGETDPPREPASFPPELRE